MDLLDDIKQLVFTYCDWKQYYELCEDHRLPLRLKLLNDLPNIEQLCKRFVESNTQERYGILNAIYGSVNTTDIGGPDNITSPHLFGWWPESMFDHLYGAGFREIVFMDEKIPHPESNFRVEAIKPLDSSVSLIDREALKQEEPLTYN